MDFESEFHMNPNCLGGEGSEYLQINDGGTEMAEPLHRFCGHDQPSSVMSTGNSLFVRYVTAVESPDAGFRAKIRTAVCGGTISEWHTTITSPNYPNNYGNSQECEWFLKMSMGYSIVLVISDLSTPSVPPGQNCSVTDFLEIRNTDAQGEILGTFCGSLINGSHVINVPGSQAYVKFKSNYAKTGKGFSLDMKMDHSYGCGGYIEGPSGTLTSPNYPLAFPVRRECKWRLVAPEGKRVSVTFQEFNLPMDQMNGACLTFVQVLNVTFWRNAPPNQNRLCGSSLPPTMRSFGSELAVGFQTYGLAAGQGFSLTYSTEEENICGGVLTLPSGVIATPNITDAEAVMDCKWSTSGDQFAGNKTTVFRFDVVDNLGSLANYCRGGVLVVRGDTSRTFLGNYCGNYTSQVVVTSPYPSTVVRFVASVEKPIGGLHGTYNVTDCGGVVSGVNLQLSSPNYPNGYPPNTDCHWNINVERGETIVLNVVDLSLESNCDKDYVLVLNGYYLNSPVLARLCGDNTHAPIVSSSSSISVIFHSDAYGTAPGFSLSTTEVQRGCGGLIHMRSGNISSPNSPAQYDNNVECRWTIEYVPGYVIRLEFIGRFDIEMDANCEKDYLLLEQYEEDGSWSSLDRKCGSSTPSIVVSKSRNMRLTFHSNSRITGDGFYLKYSAACAGNFTELKGEIFSPEYPEFYRNNLNCTYTIGKSQQYVSISFDDYFSIEGHDDCVYDYVQLTHGDEVNKTVQGPYCGTVPPAPRTLEGPVTVTFVTDSSYHAHGFRLKYEILDCGAILTDPMGSLSTPRTPTDYLEEVDCTWQIVAPSNKVIAFRFASFDIPVNFHCFYNYVELRDGLSDGPLIAKICGNASVPIVKSTGNILTVRYRMVSGAMPRLPGFSAFYYMTYGPGQDCGGTITASSGEVQSLDVDSNGLYEPNLDCSWLLISDSADMVLRVTFERFDIEPSTNGTCIHDFIELRDGLSQDSPLMGQFCDSESPGAILTSGNNMQIVFHSDNENNRAGFKLKFETVASPCGTSSLVSQTEPQTLKSPNYPSPYPLNLGCKWTIVRENNSTGYFKTFEMVHLTLTDFGVPCDGDYLQVQKINPRVRYTHRTSSMHRFPPIRLCGSTPTHDIIAASGVILSFHSDSTDNAARGFSLTYRDADCSRTYTSSSGVITSPSYPSIVNQDRWCNVTILAEQGQTVALYFSRMEMYGGVQTHCGLSSVKVYDGPNNSSSLIGSFCDYNPPNPIFSTGSSLHIESFMNNGLGLFSAIYMTTDQGRGCGGAVYSESGVISSPLYPHTYMVETECSWTVTVPGYHTVKVEFQAFALNSTAGCETNYVEIYDIADVAGRVARFCGSDSPGVHYSQSNRVMIKFKSSAFNNGPGFLLNFESNDIFPGTSATVIQRHDVGEEEDPSAGVIYLN